MLKKWLLVGLAVLLIGAMAVPVLAQGDDEEEPDVTIDWCDVVNNDGETMGVRVDEPGYYDIEVPTFSGSIDFGSLPPLDEITLDDLLSLSTGTETITVYVQDFGVDCRTGDPPGVERLWDDRMTFTIFRNPNMDVAFYSREGRHIHTTPYYLMFGDYEMWDVIDEHETIGGTLRLFYLYDNVYQMSWFAPDGSEALAIRFTYPEPCVDDTPGQPRVCDE